MIRIPAVCLRCGRSFDSGSVGTTSRIRVHDTTIQCPYCGGTGVVLDANVDEGKLHFVRRVYSALTGAGVTVADLARLQRVLEHIQDEQTDKEQLTNILRDEGPQFRGLVELIHSPVGQGINDATEILVAMMGVIGFLQTLPAWPDEPPAELIKKAVTDRRT